MKTVQKIIFSLALVAAFSTHASTYKFAADKGKVSFLAKGRPALISIQGEGEGASGELTIKEDQLSGEISFRVDTLKTGIELRDEHMQKKYLQSGEYPVAHLRIEKANLPKGFTSGAVSVKGTLNLHGVDKEVVVDAVVSNENGLRKIKSEFAVKLSDFKIDIPSFKGITVAEDVKIKIETSPVVVQ